MANLGSLWYTMGIKDLTDADLNKINAKLKNLGFDITLTPKILKDLTQSAVPKGIKIELDPTIKNEALAKAIEGKTMKVAVTPLLTGFREAIIKAARENPPQAEVGVSETRLRTLIQNVLNKQGFMLNISTVKDNYSKVVQQKLNGTRYTVKIHVDAKEITRSVQASLMQVQGRYFGLKVSRDILYRSIDEALGNHKFPITVFVRTENARSAVQTALNKAAGMSSQEILNHNRLMKAEAAAAAAELNRVKAAHIGAADAAKTHATASVSLGSAMGRNITIAGELGSTMASMYSIHAAKQFLSQVIEIGGELEHQKIAMDTIFGDKGKTAELFGQIKSLARQSPFGVMELTKNVKALSAYGVEYNEIYETSKRLADISAATSVDISRLILAFGKTKSRGFLDGLEAKQFAYANIPIYEMVRKKLEELEGQAVTTQQVMERMRKREIGFDIVKDVLWDMTDPGGKFYNMQEALAGSVKTSWKLVRDNIELMFGEIAEGSVGSALKSVAEILQGLTREWRTLGWTIGAGVAAFGVYKVAVLANNTMLGQLNLTSIKSIQTENAKQVQLAKTASIYRKLTYAEADALTVESALNQAQKGSILTRKRLTAADVEYLYASKALTKDSLLRLAATGRLQRGALALMRQTDLLTYADMRYLVQLRQTNSFMGFHGKTASALAIRFKLLGNSIKTALAPIGAMVASPITWIMAAIGAGVAVWQKHNEQMEKAKEIGDNIFTKATEGASNLKQILKDIKKSDGLSNLELERGIEQLEQAVKDYSPKPLQDINDTLVAQDGHVMTLIERYDALKNKVEELNAAYNKAGDVKTADAGTMVSDAIKPTSSWGIDGTVAENAKAYTESLKKRSDAIRKMSADEPRMIKKAVDAAIAANGAFAKAAEGMKTTAAMWAELASNPEKYKMETNLPEVYGLLVSGPINSIFNLTDSIKKNKNRFEVDVEDFIKDITENIRITWRKEISELDNSEKGALAGALKNMLDQAEGVSEEVKQQWAKILEKAFNIDLGFKIDVPKALRDKLNDNLVDRVGTVIAEKARKGITLSKSEMAQFKHAVHLTYVDLFNAADEEGRQVLNSVYGPGFDTQSRIANLVLTGLKTPTTTTSNDRGDPFADKLKQRFKDIKDAYSMYKEWAKLEGQEAAFKRVGESGLFSTLAPENIPQTVDEYLALIDKIENELKAAGIKGKSQRENLAHDLIKERLGIDKDSFKVALDKAKTEIDALVKDFTRKWDFQKQLFELTGNREAAVKLAFGENVAWQTQGQMLESLLNTQLAEKGLVVPLDISDEEAKEKLEGTALYDLLWEPAKEAKLKEPIELQLNVAKAVADAASISEKIQTQMGLRDAEENLLRSSKKADGAGYSEAEIAASLKKYDDKIDELKSSMLELLPIWEQIFGDHQYQSYEQIQKASDIAQQIINNAKIKKDANGKPVSFTSVYTDVEGNEQQITGKISQLEKLRNAIQNLYKEGLKKNPFVTLWDGLKKIFNGDWNDKSTAKKLALIGESAAECADMVGSLAGQLSELFEAMGDAGSAQAMSDIQDAMSTVSNIGKGFAQGGIIGGIAAAAGEAIGWATKAFQASARHKEALRAIMNETIAQQREYNLLLMQQNLEYKKASTLFGDNTYGKALNAVKVLKQAYKDLREATTGTDEQKQGQKSRAKIFSALRLRNPNSELKEAYAGLADIKVKTGHKKTGLFGWGKGEDIYSSILDVYPDLIDANGKFNSSLAETIISTRTMSEENKAALQNMIDLAEQAEAAYEEMNSYMTDIFGELGSSMTDALVSAFANGTDAAESFYDSVSDMLEALAKQMIYSVTLAPLIEEAQKRMMDVMQDEGLSDEQKFEAWANVLEGLLDNALKEQGVANDLFAKYQDIAAEKGFDIFKPGNEQKSGLTAGLQSLTEDTGDLLASYVNAIRADVSVSRMNWDKLMDEALPQMNVIAESQLRAQQQIAENTLRNAIAAETIVKYSKSIDDRLRRAQADKSTGFWFR